MMKKSVLVILPLGFLGAAAAAAIERSVEPALIARSVMSPDETPAGDAANPCPVGREFRLVSVGTHLELQTQRVALKTENCPRPAPDFRDYKVSQVRVQDGIKVYEADGATGKVTLTDSRGSETAAAFPWRAVLRGTEDSTRPTNKVPASEVFIGGEIEDVNLTASGAQTYDILVWLDRPMSQSEVQKLCYSLKVESTASVPVNPNQPKAYQVRIASDLAAPHVLSQLRALQPVVDLAPVDPSKDPIRPPKSALR